MISNTPPLYPKIRHCLNPISAIQKDTHFWSFFIMWLAIRGWYHKKNVGQVLLYNAIQYVANKNFKKSQKAVSIYAYHAILKKNSAKDLGLFQRRVPLEITFSIFETTSLILTHFKNYIYTDLCWMGWYKTEGLPYSCSFGFVYHKDQVRENDCQSIGVNVFFT